MPNIAPFLALNTRNGTPRMKRYVNATPANQGVNITGSAADGVDATLRGYVPIVKFGGSRTFLVTVGGKVFRTTDAGATWATVLTLTNINPNTNNNSGLWVLHVLGVATVCIVWADGGSNVYAATSADGVNWSAILGPFSASAQILTTFNDVVPWRGNLVLLAHDQNAGGQQVITFDPTNGTMTFIVTGTIAASLARNNGAICVYNDRLFFISGQYSDANNPGTVRLFEVVGAVATFVGYANGRTTVAAPSNGAVDGQATTIAILSNGVALPTGTINVASTTGFPASGTAYVVTSLGSQLVSYTGISGTSLTGCTGGSGTMSTGGAVTSATVHVASTAGFPPTGVIQLINGFGDSCTYTGITGTSFTGCVFTGGSTLATGYDVSNFVDSGSNAAKFTLYVDQNGGTPKLIALWVSNDVRKWHATKFDSALVATDITDTVFTGIIQFTSSALLSGRIGVIVDDRSVPGTADPVIYLMLSQDGANATVFTQWLWSISGVATLKDTGGSADQSLPYVKFSQGVTFWTLGEYHVEQKGTSPAVNGVYVLYTLYQDAPVKPTTGTVVAGSVDIGTHLWATVFVTAAGDGPLGAPSTSLNIVTTAKNVPLTTIEVGGLNVTSRKLYRTKANQNGTVAAGSNGVNLNTFTGSATLNAGASTAAFPASGTIYVTDNTGLRHAVTYTGIAASTFTGCTCTSAGILATGGIISGPYFLVPTSTTLNDNTTTAVTDTTADSGLGASPAVTATASVRVWQGTAPANYPLVAATTVPALPLTAVPVDNATLNTFRWNAAADGFVTGQRGKLLLEQF